MTRGKCFAIAAHFFRSYPVKSLHVIFVQKKNCKTTQHLQMLHKQPFKAQRAFRDLVPGERKEVK